MRDVANRLVTAAGILMLVAAPVLVGAALPLLRPLERRQRIERSRNSDLTSMATDIVSLVSENIFGALKAAPKVVTSPHAPVPFSSALEDLYIPSQAKIEAAVRAVMDAGQKKAAQ